MPRRLTKDIFIEKSKGIHGDKYDYSKVEYVNNSTKVCIICPKHGEFFQKPSEHLKGKGCKKCGICKSHKIMSSDEWIEKAKNVATNLYDYSKVDYKGNKIKVEIICKKHGSFLIKPNDFLSGHFCPKCGIEKRTDKISLNNDEFINKMEKIFPEYDYSLVDYKNAHKKVKLICPKHGLFESLPYHLLHGHGCYKCGQEKTHNKQRKTLEKFVEEARNIHGDKYDYSKSIYLGRDKKTCIICPKHGEFYQTPHGHVGNKQGCPRCNNSLLEEEIMKLLTFENVKFEQYKKFNWLGLQSLDFYLPEYNVAIECQGIQHFEVVEHFGGINTFEKRLENDAKKKKLCEENGIKLLYFSNFKKPNIYNDGNKLINEIKNGI